MARAKSLTRLDQILDASSEVFLELGYRRTLLADVATRAGVSAGAIYLYAASKEALFVLTLRRAFGDPAPPLADLPFEVPADVSPVAWVWDRFRALQKFPKLEAAAGRKPPRDVMRELADILSEVWSWMAANWRAIELIERCAKDWPELHALFYHQFRRGAFALAVRYFSRRMDEGRLRRYPHVGTAVRVVNETLAFFAMHRHVRPDSADLDETVARQTVITMLLAGFDPAIQPVPNPPVEIQ